MVGYNPYDTIFWHALTDLAKRERGRKRKIETANRGTRITVEVLNMIAWKWSMATWVIILFFLGLFGTVVSRVAGLDWFAPWWSVILMVVAFSMLKQIWRKEETGEKEKLLERMQDLEGKLRI